MAATTRATSTEPFPALENGPRTPTSLAKAPNSKVGNEPSGPKVGKPGVSPVSLTGVAAAAENRRREQRREAEEVRETSPNLPVQAMHSLMGGGGMSRSSDAPAPDKLSEPLQKAAEKMHVVDGVQDNTLQTSPTSMSSFGTIESTGAPTALTATANDAPASGQQFVAEPAQMTDGAPYHNSNGNLEVAADQEGHKAFSYPGPPPQEQDQGSGPSRGMSLPGYGQGSPKSPASNKRHKCPYCSTDFTRHHNLKSHLLTHSQEKPYVCQTCQARFRRLHDLKRHTKLHTGERPHTCEKCGRKFARGDALARHNKGPGGCAGRRSSFGGDDEWGPDGEAMDGMEYDDEGSSPDQGRRVSEPSRKRTHLETPQDPHREVYRQHSSTYPPPYHQQPQSRQHAGSIGSMGPPQVVLSGQNTTSSPRDMSNATTGGSSINSAYYGNSGQVLPQQGMIESPKPLSPGQPAPDQHRLSVGDASMSSAYGRNRSPSLTAQFQQAHFGRGNGGRTPPQHSTQYATSHQGPPQAPVLPPLTSQPQTRSGHGHPTTSLPGGPGPSMLHHQQVAPATAGQGSNHGSLSSHGRSSGSSIRDLVGQDQNDIWAYVRTLEQRLGRLQDEYELRISRLQDEVISLKGQLSNAASYSSDMGQARY